MSLQLVYDFHLDLSLSRPESRIHRSEDLGTRISDSTEGLRKQFPSVLGYSGTYYRQRNRIGKISFSEVTIQTKFYPLLSFPIKGTQTLKVHCHLSVPPLVVLDFLRSYGYYDRPGNSYSIDVNSLMTE